MKQSIIRLITRVLLFCTSLLLWSELEDFEGATNGGFWVATGELR
jgi:hypothetical protein